MKKILVLGATGRTGRYALDYALSPQKQLQVVAMVRNPTKLAARPGLTIVTGYPDDLNDVRDAIHGCDAVLSFLGSKQKPNLLTMAATNAAFAMKSEGIRRIVVLSALGVGDSYALLPAPAKWLVERSKLKQVFADHANAERVLEASDLDWTSVRAALLLGRGLTRTRLTERGQPRPNPIISRQTVATFMIDCLLHREFFGRALVASRD